MVQQFTELIEGVEGFRERVIGIQMESIDTACPSEADGETYICLRNGDTHTIKVAFGDFFYQWQSCLKTK